VLQDLGDGHLAITAPRWGGFTEVVPQLAMAGAEFVEINGNDEIVFTTVEDADSEATPAFARLLFNSMVISPTGKKRSVYVVQVADLSQALNSLAAKDVQLEHIFDF
jgi:hypothetical protein